MSGQKPYMPEQRMTMRNALLNRSGIVITEVPYQVD